MVSEQFLLGDIVEDPGAGFIIHTRFPKFILNWENYELQMLEQIEPNNEIQSRIELLIQKAHDFYNQALIIKE